MRIRAHVVRIEHDKGKAFALERTVTRLHREAARRPRLLRVEPLEIVIPEQVMPRMSAPPQHGRDGIETLPVPIDQIAEVDAERQVASIEMLHRLPEPANGLAIKSRFGRI